MFRMLRRFLPFSRLSLVLFAWRNRDEVKRWLGFGTRSLRRVQSGGRDDVVTEARIRAAMTRTRDRRVTGVEVDVRGGVATLTGVVEPDVHNDLVALAERTPGVHSVVDRLQVSSRGWGLFR